MKKTITDKGNGRGILLDCVGAGRKRRILNQTYTDTYFVFFLCDSWWKIKQKIEPETEKKRRCQA
jgi:hypothetical protein